MADDRGVPTQPANTIWLLTFTDLVALLLTFFVMLFAMSNVQVDRWKNLIDTLSTTLNPTRAEVVPEPVAEYNISSIFRKRAINLEYLHAVLDQKVARSEVLKDSVMVLLEDRLIVSLAGGRLFEATAPGLAPEARAELFELGGVLRNIENQIAVNGYAEAAELASASYTSDWELSLARAISVANALKSAGYSGEILSYGYGSSRNVFLAGVSEERRRILSRRIDIVIMAAGGAL